VLEVVDVLDALAVAGVIDMLVRVNEPDVRESAYPPLNTPVTVRTIVPEAAPVVAGVLPIVL
jgi:hypothetical protein